MLRSLLLAALLAQIRTAARAAEIVVAAPDPVAGPYAEALRGVCDGLGACPPLLAADAELPADARVVIALGGRAARRRFPPRAVLVTALTPGLEARAARRDGPVVRVRLTYSPADFVRRLSLARPDARRIALLWNLPGSGRYAQEAAAAASAVGLSATVVEVDDAEGLPALLRGLPPVDAVWLSPEPGLVTPSAFAAVAEFARSRGIVFYAPAPGLADHGADGSLAPGFRAAGLRAAAAARAALAERPPSDTVYPDEATITPLSALAVSTRPAPGQR